jgi:ubiquinone/menaquinone biosynthesis C-methylase UbiE
MQRASDREEGSLKYVDLRNFGDGQVNAIISALQFQHKLYLFEMGGELLPPEIPIAEAQTVMDFICGPGDWCIDFSTKYPDKQVYGLDSNYKMVTLAQENAAHTNTGKLEFRGVNRPPPLLFEDATFDLIHIQNGTSLFTLEEWPAIMAEMYRLLKPGGWLNLVDFEMGPTSSPALDRVLGFLGQILMRLNRSNAPDGLLPFNGCTLGPQHMARQSFTEIKYHLYPVNLGGWNNPIGRAYLNSIVVRPEMILGLATETKISTEEKLRPLLREMQRELQQIGFCGAGMLLSSFGRKPPASG